MLYKNKDTVQQMTSLMNQVAANIEKLMFEPGGSAEGRRLMKTKPVKAARESRPFVLAPKTERALTRMGHGPLIRKLKAAASGRASPRVRAFFRSCNELRARFLAASPALDDKVLGRVVTYLVETVEYADSLSGRLREIRRIRGRARRGDLRLILGIIYDIEIGYLWSLAESLRRDIPRLYEQLGGNPSEDLMLPRKRAKRQ
jgi:hypothetical protein